MKNLIALLLISFIFFSCTDNKKEETTQKSPTVIVQDTASGLQQEMIFDASVQAENYSIQIRPDDSIVNLTITRVKKITPPPPADNLPPVVTVGNNQVITLPTNQVTITGSAADPDGMLATIAWTKVAGGSATITNPTQLITTVTGMVAGTYSFKLTATDNKGAITSATTTVIVNPVVVPPVGGVIEGFGVDAVGGGNSSNVVTVTSASAFKSALGSNKTIKFGANVTITGVTITSSFSYCTIDGNGFDVVFSGIDDDGISFDGSGYHHIILKNITVRNCTGDGINVVNGAHDILITNCSSYGNQDGNIDVASSSTGATKNITVQYCILGANSGSGKMLVTAQSVSVHHNIFVGSGGGEGDERNPYVHANYAAVGSPNIDFRNNLLYNWGRYGSGIGYRATGNFVNNYYASNKGGAFNPAADPNGNTASYYLSGNVQVGGANINNGNHAEYIIPSKNTTTTQSACDAAKTIKAKVGPRLANGGLSSENQTIVDKVSVTCN